jgi:transcriptional regulator with XRE-family HTH domain
MASITASNLSLVPPRRLGALLAERRSQYSFSVEEMARRSMGRFDTAALEAIEAGVATIDDVDIESLSLLYEFNSTPPRPQRSKLILAADEDVPLPFDSAAFDDAMVDAVLTRYVALLHLLRNIAIGGDLPLRADDLEMLSDAFSMSEQAVTERVDAIRATQAAEIAEQAERMRRRLVVPAAGLLVGPTPAGMLVLVK